MALAIGLGIIVIGVAAALYFTGRAKKQPELPKREAPKDGA